jgi:hypothetical protein
MARSKKKTPAQQVMSVAAIALPAPVRDAVVSRWGARISLIVAAALLASGILTVQWTDGKPHVEVNRERAQQAEHLLEERAEQRLHEFQHQHEDQGGLADRWGFRKSHD